MATKSFGITLRGFHFEDWQFTFNLAAGITTNDVGKAVALDTSAPNTVKLAGDGDKIIGRLEVVENRTQDGSLVGNVALKFINALPKSGVINIGDRVVGAGTGAVKAAAADVDGGDNYVVEVGSTYVVVVKE
jgi:hypothetical protein